MKTTGRRIRRPGRQHTMTGIALLVGICLVSVISCIPAVALSGQENTHYFYGEKAVLPTTAPAPLCMPAGQPGPASSPYIHPVGWHMAGDSFAITGTTSLPADHVIMVNVLCGHSLTLKTPAQNCDGISGEADVIPATPAGTGIWSYRLNTSGFQPDHYIVTVISEFNGSIAESYGDFFLLSPAASVPPEHFTVKIDPIPSFSSRESVVFSGTTTDPAGDPLNISITSGVFLPGGIWQPRTNVSTGEKTIRTMVTPGKNNENTWSAVLDPGSLEQGDYLIEALSPSGERKGYGFFTIRPEPSPPCSLQTATVSPPQGTRSAPVPVMLLIATACCCFGLHAYCRKK
jgi:hypothetical protein